MLQRSLKLLQPQLLQKLSLRKQLRKKLTHNYDEINNGTYGLVVAQIELRYVSSLAM